MAARGGHSNAEALYSYGAVEDLTQHRTLQHQISPSVLLNMSHYCLHAAQVAQLLLARVGHQPKVRLKLCVNPTQHPHPSQQRGHAQRVVPNARTVNALVLACEHECPRRGKPYPGAQ